MSSEPGLGRLALPDAVLRLLSVGAADSFLGAHHAEAAAWLMALFERSRMRQRVTMSFDPARVGSGRNAAPQADLADSAADARRRLQQMARAMPADCWDVLTDVCGFDKGLQQIELDRLWPRRSAKLVLRIALEHLAAGKGLGKEARGRDEGPVRAWLPKRPKMFDDDSED